MLLSVQLFSAEVHVLRFIVAEALMLRREQIVAEHQEIRVLARCDGALLIIYAELLRAVDRIAQDHFFDAHFLAGRRIFPIGLVGGRKLLYRRASAAALRTDQGQHLPHRQGKAH